MGLHVAIDSPDLPEAAQLWQMAKECELDLNSPYHYALWCRDFAGTTAIARVGEEAAGFVTAYRRQHNGALFIWQIGVLERFRQHGLALAMLEDLWQRDATTSVLEATVTPDNTASRRLFRSFADLVGGSWHEELLFPGSLFPVPHDDECLIRIGPVRRTRSAGPPRNETEKKGAPGA